MRDDVSESSHCSSASRRASCVDAKVGMSTASLSAMRGGPMEPELRLPWDSQEELHSLLCFFHREAMSSPREMHVM